MMTRIRTYTELMQLPTHKERYEYLRLSSVVGEMTFGYKRYLNQILYKSKRWKQTRDTIILRDAGCDLAIPHFKINNKIIIHHMNPLTPEDVSNNRETIFEPEGLICVTLETHNAIHYGDEHQLQKEYVERSLNDTCPWRRKEE